MMALQLTYQAYGQVHQLFKEMTIIRTLPPATKYVRMCRACKFYDDCAENIHRGGLALCEMGVVEQAGDSEVIW